MKMAHIEILLIEDALAEADLMREMLAESRRWEFSVEHVRNLADGLALLKDRSYDCVLVDLGLPDSQGLETALAVRNHAKLAPIAIVTILDDEELALKALQMDIQDYLVEGRATAQWWHARSGTPSNANASPRSCGRVRSALPPSCSTCPLQPG